MTRCALPTTLAFGLALSAAAQEAPTSPKNDYVITFKQIDGNGDGRINRDESMAIDGFDFTLADANGDRMLSRVEFAAALEHGAAQPTFSRIDKNRDGKIERKEAGEIDGLNFNAADSDHDRGLNPAEFRLAMRWEASP